MNLEQLQAIRDKERSTDSLQSVRGDFYEEAAAYIESLREERTERAAAVDDPFADDTIRQLSDEIETAHRTVEAIYERRIGKLVKQASFAAADLPADDDALTDSERHLYTDLIDRISAHRQRVLALLESPVEGPTAEGDPTAEHRDSGGNAVDVAPGAEGTNGAPSASATDTPEQPTTERADRQGSPASASGLTQESPESSTANGSAASSPDAEERETTVRRTTVRMAADVGEIVGIDDRTYDLATDDIVTLPAPNAEPLLERDAAERLDPT